MSVSKEGDGRYFAWVRDVMPWIEPKLCPQLILDVGVADYMTGHQNTQARLDVVVKHVLKVDEYKLTLDQLIKKYPAPKE